MQEIEKSVVELVDFKLRGYEQDYKNLVKRRMLELIARMVGKGIDMTAEQAYDVLYKIDKGH